MVRYHYFIRTSLLLFLFSALLFSQSVSLATSKTHFSLNEEIQLTFNFEDIRNAPNRVSFDLHKDLQITGGPSSSVSYQWINGRSSSSTSINYNVIARRAGEIRLPAYEFEIKGKKYRTEALTLYVGKTEGSEDAKELPEIFVKLVMPKDFMYQGETMTLSYYLYSSEQIGDYNTSAQQSLEAFIIDSFRRPNTPAFSRKVLGGKEYRISEAATLTLTAAKSGQYIIPAKAFRVFLKRRDPYASFFSDPFFGLSNSVNVYSEPDTISVFPLPPGADSYFTGAIGDFSMHVSLDSSLIRENQATTLRVDIVGNGNLPHFSFPEQKLPRGVEVFEPKVKDNFQLKEQDYRGKRSWEYVLIPSQTGTIKFDDIQFTYFSLKDKQYKTIRMPVKEIRVLSQNEIEGDYLSTLSPEEVRLLAKDIRFLQLEEKRLIPDSYDALRNPRNKQGFILLIIIILGFILMEHFFSVRDRNLHRIRYQRALKNTVQHFRRLTEEETAEKYLNGIEEGLLNYLKDKQLDYDIHKDISDVLKTIETYKYAPGLLSRQHLEQLKDRIIEMIKEIEEG